MVDTGGAQFLEDLPVLLLGASDNSYEFHHYELDNGRIN